MLQGNPDVCAVCTKAPDAEFEYSIEGNVGTCAALATLEKVAAGDASKGGLGTGDASKGGLGTAGKVTIPLGILGFVGGLLIGWYRLKSDKKAKKEQDELATKMQAEMEEGLRQMQLSLKAQTPKKKKKKKKNINLDNVKTTAGSNVTSNVPPATAIKLNPLFSGP